MPHLVRLNNLILHIKVDGKVEKALQNIVLNQTKAQGSILFQGEIITTYLKWWNIF